jgi:uncharacterized integral membrane protein
MVSLIVVLFVVFLVALFSVQNASPVAISFLFWRFEASLAIVIFLSALAGVLITVAIYSSRAVKKALSAKKAPAEIVSKPDVKE